MNFDEIPRAGSVSLRSGHAWRGTLRRLHFQQIDGSLVERPATSRMRSAEANFGGSCEIVLRRSSRLPIVFVGALRARPSIRQSIGNWGTPPSRGSTAMLVFPEACFVSFVISILLFKRKLCASPAFAFTDVGGASRFLKRPSLTCRLQGRRCQANLRRLCSTRKDNRSRTRHGLLQVPLVRSAAGA